MKPDKTGDDFERYIEVQKLLNREKSYRTSLTKESVNEMQSLFSNNEV